MAGAASSQLRSAYIAETTPGTTPATPGFTTFDDAALFTATPQIIEQKTLQSLGARTDQAVGGLSYTGSMSGNLVYGNLDTMLETLLQGTWATNVLKDARSIKTVTVENAIPAGVGGTTTMMRYLGVQAVGATISLKSQQEVGYSLDLRGMSAAAATTTAITGATYSDPSATIPLASGVDVGTIAFSGYTMDAIESADINFSFDGRDDQPQVGSVILSGITRGALVPVINVRVYVDSNFLAIYNAAQANHTAFSATFPLGSVSGSKYTLLFPQCMWASADLDFSAVNAMHDLVIFPQYDATTNNSVVKLTRAVA